MAYVWMNIIIALTAGLATGLLLFNWLKSKRLIYCSITLTATILAFLAAVFLITPYYKMKSFAQQLRIQPVFAVLEVQEPNIFNAFLAASRPLALKQKRPAELALAAEQLEQRVFIKMLNKAPNTEIMSYLNATIALYKKLLSVNPKLVLIYEFPQKFTQVSTYAIDTRPFQQEYDQFNHVKATLTINTLKNPQKAPARFEVEHLVNYIRSQLASKYGEKNVQLAFTQPASAELDPTIGAQIITSYYQKLAKLSPSSAGKIMRFANKATS